MNPVRKLQSNFLSNNEFNKGPQSGLSNGMKNNLIVIIPAYNEEKTIGKVIEEVKALSSKIIVVDDGSADKTAEIAKAEGAEVISHLFNLGLGAALKTGFAAAKKIGPGIVVTMDADLQHEAELIPQITLPIEKEEAEAVIGSRLKDKKSLPAGRQGMPLTRKLFNQMANLTTWFFYGLLVSDSQSGFRAFSTQALGKIKLKGLGMEISSEIIGEIKRNKFKFKEIPIRAIYTDYSLSKGQNFWLGVKTFFRILIDKITA